MKKRTWASRIAILLLVSALTAACGGGGGGAAGEAFRWSPLSTTNTPTTRTAFSSVWTGTELIVWGGSGQTGYLNSGGRYNPVTNVWTAVSTTNAPAVRGYHTAVWTGSKMIVWGGWNGASDLKTGGIYDPVGNTWSSVTTTSSPASRYDHSAVWTGTEMVVWSGISGTTYLNTGGRYNPTTNLWTGATATVGAPTGRLGHGAVWAGDKMIVWGGSTYNSTLFMTTYYKNGGRYDPVSNLWTAVTTTNAPEGRDARQLVWTGTEAMIWGGAVSTMIAMPPTYFSSGGRYNPASNIWTSVTSTNAPSLREGHSTVWTGTEMIVWGGGYNDMLSNTQLRSTGGKYSPTSDTWAATSLAGVPDARMNHAAVWTGTDMIVWGGTVWSGSSFNTTNTGGIFSP